MDSVKDLERRLAVAKKREADLSATHCLKCNGAGWFDDTTYDRTGSWSKCNTCHGTGWPIGRVRAVFDAAFAKHVEPKPQSNKGEPRPSAGCRISSTPRTARRVWTEKGEQAMSVVLEPSGAVKVDGEPIPGRWWHVPLGAAYFEDPGGMSTDVMSKDALRTKLAEMYSAESKQEAG